MAGHLIYVISDGKKDLSRWLSVSSTPDGGLTVHLSDLCHPGRISGLQRVNCPATYFQGIFNGGALQIVYADGYLIARSADSLVSLEFKGLRDESSTKVTVSAEELHNRLAALSAS